jgi:hypothetical protein
MDRHERKNIIDRLAAIDAQLNALKAGAGADDLAQAVVQAREWCALKMTLDAIHEADDAG